MRKRIRERNRTWETRRSLLSITFHHPRVKAVLPRYLFLLALSTSTMVGSHLDTWDC